MKTPATPSEKKPKEPRCECRATLYSEAALRMMEQATGQRLTRAVATPKAAPVQAVDAD